MSTNKTPLKSSKARFPFFHAFFLILLFTFYMSVNGYSETRLDTDTLGAGGSWWPTISSDNSGHVYVTWRDLRNGRGDIYFNYSSDYGVTWQASDIRLDTGDAAGANESRWPEVSCDGSGHVYVTWDDRRNGLYDIYFNYSNDYGVTWQASAIRLDTDTAGASHSLYPQIKSDSSGHVYVAWNELRNGSYDIYFNYSSDYGTTWQAGDIRIDTDTPGASHSFVPFLNTDGSGYVYAVWEEYRNGSVDIYFNYSSDYGVTWQGSDIRLDTGDTPGASDSWWPKVISDGSGYVYVIWEDYRNGSGDIYFNYSNDYGATWQGSAIRIDTGDTLGASESWYPQISNDGNGHVYVTWEDYRNVGSDIYFNYSSDYGATWQASDRRLDVGDNAGVSNSTSPQISSDGSGYVYVTWYDQRNGKNDIYFYYSSNHGATWQVSDTRVDIGDTPGAGESLYPEVITDSNGYIYVVWHDQRDGGPDIYFDTLSPDPGGDPTQTTTTINTGDDWRYFKGYSNPSAGWTDISFDDSGWLIGSTGIGYGDGDDATVLSDMQNNYLTVYARKTFNVSDTSTLTGMRLRMDYDDGFVAYINGQEVARANMPGGTIAFDTRASSNHEAGTPEVFDLDSYTGNLVTGTNVLAIEIHNRAIGNNDLSMIPELDIENSIGGGLNDITPPTIPANLTATAFSQSKINLSWDASTDDIGVTGYNIFRNGGGTPIATVTGTTYQDTELSPATFYTYNVSAIDAVPNESAQSSQASDTTFAPDTTPPSTPANVTATAVSPYQIDLSWDASTDNVGVTGYNIYRDGGGTPIATVTGTTYQDTGLSPATLYTYNVSAIDDESNESAQSSPASDTTGGPDTTPPSTPANLTTTAVSTSRINLSWDASTDNIGVTGYNIYRDGGGTPIATVTGTTYQDTGLSEGTLYTYNVSAIDAAPNESAQSSPASDTTLNTTTTFINTGDTWKYFKGYSNPSAGWTDISFDDSGWLSGATGIGFGDGDDATVLSDMRYNYRTVYARKTFSVIDASYVTGLTFRIDYDDGFVAYLNGQEVTRANMPVGTPAYNTNASSNHEAGTSEAFNLNSYTGSLVSGTNVLVIEIHNSAIGNNDLSMIPELDVIFDDTPPSTPANLTATAVSPYQIDLSWDASTDNIGVSGYNIYRDGGGIPIATTTGTTYQDTGLSPSTLYTYKVSAIDTVPNESAQSSQASDTTDTPDTTPPSTPANLTATTVSADQIDLSWDASTDNVAVTGYNIYRDGGENPIATATGTTYQDTGLSQLTSYTYNVSAIDAALNESAQSSPDSDTTLSPIAVDFVSSGLNGTAGNSLSFNHTIGSGSDRILVVGIAGEDGTAADLVISSVTYNGVAMYQVTGSSSTVGTSLLQKTEIYYLLDNELPPAGTYSVVVTYAGTVDDRSGGAISFFNVAQQTAEAVNINANTSSNTISTDINVISDGAFVVDVVGCGNSGTFTATGSGMNEQFDVSPDSSTAAGSTLQEATAGTTTMSWQHSGANRLAHSVAAFEPAIPDVNPPSTPANLTATAISGYQIDLSWDASTGVAGYNIYRDGGGTPIATVTGTTYQDTGLSPLTSYTYNVSAIDAVPNESAQSSPASDTTGSADTIPPSTPANLTATAVSADQIDLSWDASTDNVAVTGYNIYRDGGGTPIATTAGTTYQDTGLSPLTSYTYNVSAIDGAPNESAQSSPDSDTTLSPIEVDFVSSGLNGTAGNSLSFNHTIGSGSDRILVVGIAGEDGTAADLVVSSVTYYGIAMQPVAGSSATVGTSLLQKTEIYYLLDNELPPAGTYSVVVTYAGTVDDRSGGAISLFNVAQQTAEAVNINANTSSNTISTDINVISDGAVVVDVVGCGNSGSFTATGSGMAEQFDVSPDSSTAAGSTLQDAAAGTVSMSWQHSGANRLAHSVASFAPAP